MHPARSVSHLGLEWFKNLAATLASLSIVLSIGFSFGFYVAHPGPLFVATMENSNVTMPGNVDSTFPCVHDGSNTEHIRCVFKNTNSTWLCSVEQAYGYRENRTESCMVIS